MTAIRRIRQELERLESQVAAATTKVTKGAKLVAAKKRSRKVARQVCGVCGQTGHNSRFHRKGRRR